MVLAAGEIRAGETRHDLTHKIISCDILMCLHRNVLERGWFGDQEGIKTSLRMPRALSIAAFLQGIYPTYLECGKTQNAKSSPSHFIKDCSRGVFGLFCFFDLLKDLNNEGWQQTARVCLLCVLFLAEEEAGWRQTHLSSRSW